MRGAVLSAVVSLLLCVAAPLAADETETLSGSEIVARAVEAAGGEAWRRPQTLYLQGDMRMFRDGAFDGMTVADDYRMWRVFPSQSDDAHAANGKVRLEARSGEDLIFRMIFDGQNTYDQNGRVEDEDANRQWSAAFGFGIIRFANDEGFSVERLADDQIEGEPCYFIRVLDPSGGETLFGIDQSDYAVRFVGFDTPRGWHHRIYSDFAWHQDPKFRQPRRVRLYYDGRKTIDINWPVFQVNGNIDDAVFEPET